MWKNSRHVRIIFHKAEFALVRLLLLEAAIDMPPPVAANNKKKWTRREEGYFVKEISTGICPSRLAGYTAPHRGRWDLLMPAGGIM